MVTPAWSIPQSVLPRLVTAPGEGEDQGEGEPAVVAHHHQGTQELVPRGDEGEEGDGDDRGDHRGQEDPAQDLPGVGAVDQRRLFQLAWHRFEGIAHDVEAERELDQGVDDGQPEAGCWSCPNVENIRKIGVSSAW